MEKNDKICREIIKESEGKIKDKVLIEALINICKYYKINDAKQIIKYVASYC